MKKPSQKKEIRQYLENGGKITAMSALNFWGCWNLKGRIYDIREDYHEEWVQKNPFMTKKMPALQEIKTEMVKTNSDKRIAEYSLVKVD